MAGQPAKAMQAAPRIARAAPTRSRGRLVEKERAGGGADDDAHLAQGKHVAGVR